MYTQRRGRVLYVKVKVVSDHLDSVECPNAHSPPTHPPTPRADDFPKPWTWAKAQIRYRTVQLTRTGGDGREMIRFNIQVYMEEFGVEQGRLLHTEFQSILNLYRESVKEASTMQVYVAIWRVLGKTWTRHIESVQDARACRPPECEGPFFSCCS